MENLVLNKETLEYFNIIANSKIVLKCKKIYDDISELNIFIYNSNCVSVEKTAENKSNYVLTYTTSIDKIADIILEFLKITGDKFKSMNNRFFINQSQYRLIKKSLDAKEMRQYKFLTSGFNLSEKSLEEIENIFIQNCYSILFVLWHKKRKRHIFHFIY